MAHQAPDISGSTNTTLVTDTRPLIHDFPLPAELKDQIYGYLLDGAQVQYTPEYRKATHSKAYNKYGSIAHTYAFHPQIMAVNKTIGAHALQVFKKRNTFIIVDFESPKCCDDRRMLHALNLPVVKTGLSSFHHRSFTIKVQQHDCASSQDDDGAALTRSVYTILMLQRDIDRLWEILHFHGQRSIPQCAYVTSRYKEPLLLTKANPTSIRPLCISVNASAEEAGSSSSADRQSDLLKSMAHLTATSCEIRLNNFAASISAQDIQSASSSSLLSVTAMDVEIIRAARTMCKHVEAEILAGRDARAIAKFSVLLHRTTGTLSQLGGFSRFEEEGDHWRSQLRVQFGINLALSLYWVFMRIGDTCAMASMLSLIGDYCAHIDPRTDYYPHLLHMTMIRRIVTADAARLPDQELGELLDQFEEISEGDAYIMHDVKIIRKALEAKAQANPPKELYIPQNELSAFALPPRIFEMKQSHEFRITEDTTRAWDDFRGWKDMKQFSEFTTAEKKAIVSFQQENGLPISTFD